MTPDEVEQAIAILYTTQADIARALGWADQSGLRHMRNGRYELTDRRRKLLESLMRTKATEINEWLEHFENHTPTCA